MNPAALAELRSRIRSLLMELKGSELPPDREVAIMNELTALHQPLISHIARQFANRGEPLEDLVQVGNLAMLKAIERFDVTRNVEFVSFLTPTVMGEIKKYFRDHAWAVRVPRGVQELRAEVVATSAEFTQRHGRSPSVRELAEACAVSEERILEALEAAHAYSALPIDAKFGTSGLSIGDQLADSHDSLNSVEWHETLAPMLAALPAREQRILVLRFVDEKSQSQIAAELGISQMHVSRLLHKSLNGLRAALIAEGETP